jgi:hypothetical protein
MKKKKELFCWNLKYYVVDTLLNNVSEGFIHWYQAEHYIKDYLNEQGRIDWRDEDRFKIIPKWKQ